MTTSDQYNLPLTQGYFLETLESVLDEKLEEKLKKKLEEKFEWFAQVVQRGFKEQADNLNEFKAEMYEFKEEMYTFKRSTEKSFLEIDSRLSSVGNATKELKESIDFLSTKTNALHRLYKNIA